MGNHAQINKEDTKMIGKKAWLGVSVDVEDGDRVEVGLGVGLRVLDDVGDGVGEGLGVSFRHQQ